MKKIMTVALIGVAALLATVSVQAQEAGFPLINVPLSPPLVIPAANDPTNFATPIVIDMKKIKVTTVNFTISTADTTNKAVALTGAWGDGVTFDTNNLVNLAAVAGASNILATATCTNTLTGNGRRYFEILSESGKAGGTLTNNAWNYGQVSSPW